MGNVNVKETVVSVWYLDMFVCPDIAHMPCWAQHITAVLSNDLFVPTQMILPGRYVELRKGTVTISYPVVLGFHCCLWQFFSLL